MEQNKNVFEETVKTLTNDTIALQKRFSWLQEKGDYRGAIDCMRLLKDTLSLIKEYDWKLEYSEYETDEHKEVAVWEQNHCGEIKNHKKWIIENSNKARNKWIGMFTPFVENNQSILYELSYDHDKEKLHRGTGKTYALEVLSEKYDIPLLTSKTNACDFNNRIGRKLAYSNYLSARETGSFTFLIDEGFTELYDEFKDDYIFIGFTPIGLK